MHPTDVAVIGLACRFPGAANPRDFWRVVRDGLEVTQLPGATDRTNTQREGLLDDVARFDADFFNVSPREACAMDPRQRLALELTWELLEDGCLAPETLRGEQVAVYIGAMTDDYAVLALRDVRENPEDPQGLGHHTFAGVSRAMIANRISYAFGLQGASATVDSGQSSSLVAVHLACEGLRTGQSAVAVAGGIHLNLVAETALLEREFGAVSASGHTYAFDGRADGYVRAEGAGLVLLKPLPAAVEDGNRVRAIIRGSAVGNAGHGSAGLTVPSVAGQVDVIRRALSAASLDKSQIDYVEAHGTGTEVGDPIEATALGEVFTGPRQRPLLLGSVKTNIGHSGAAAGVAGLIKTVLAVENAVIPASLNYVGPNPDADVNRLGLQVNTELTPWPTDDSPRRAGVSSFGMGGTNAHVIVEQAPAPEIPKSTVEQPRDDDVVVPWVLSARSGAALANQAARLLAYVSERPDLGVADVGWSLVTTRTVFEQRAVVVGDRDRLLAGVAALAAEEPGAVAGRVRPLGKVAFMFPGQGAQWLGMGRQLHARFPAFAHAFDEAARALDAHLRLPLRQVIWGSDATTLESTEFAQPALFAIELALAALWQHCGVTPDFLIGHSVGEIAAAQVAGVLSLTDAARLVAARGRLMAELPAGGAMVAVDASEEELAPMLGADVNIAAVNAADAVVISGSERSVGIVADRVAAWGRRVRRLGVSHAFHSTLMEPMLPQFTDELADISFHHPRITLVSSVTGKLAGPGYGSAAYWVEHVRKPVRFAQSVRAAEELGAGLFVEVGPGGNLNAVIEQALPLVSITKDRPEADSVLNAAGHLFCNGISVDWRMAFPGARRVELPTYGFVQQHYWLTGEEPPAPPVGEGRAEHLKGLSPNELRPHLMRLVCSHAAAVLGHSSSHDIDAESAFQELGFDSLTGVELRNRLKADTGLVLSRTLIFDYPTPIALVDHLSRQLHTGHTADDDEKIWAMLRKIPIHELRRTGLLDKLLLLAGERETSHGTTVSDDVIDSLDPEALIALALNPADGEDES
ncbi:MAG: acyltransferase domain-containing protein [Mycobacterium sp.]|uniref:type I polyketide synthase n=1 Tax=Mycobacterium sp. TaxID=1785 RepID=UPI001EBEE34F|nr:acyltransferase domain-containing protein [Mycobacterium sp.]MBW0017710.1 acyltransferase domain-containing protein [Mycobacterium sp.]